VHIYEVVMILAMKEHLQGNTVFIYTSHLVHSCSQCH